MRNSYWIVERVARRWRLLPKWGAWAELGLFLRVLAFGLNVRWLRQLKWSRLHGLLERRFRQPSPAKIGNVAKVGNLTNVREENLLRCVEGALNFGRPLVPGDCLTLGLTRYYFLRQAGVPVTLCFGIPLAGGALVAGPGHCWLEREGLPYLEEKDPRKAFLPVHRLPFQEPDEDEPKRLSTVDTRVG